MNFVIPMAGAGSRFKNVGFKKPKMLLEAHGKTLLEWSVDSLPLEICTNLIFIGLKKHQIDFNVESFIKKKYNKYNIKFIWLDKMTRGQAETVYKAKDLINFNTDLVIFNIDTFFVSKTLKENLKNNKVDGVLGAFKSKENRFSYAKLENNYVIKTAEKDVISEYALTGLYHFKSPKDFFEICKKHLDKNILYNNEFYIAPMYNDLIKQKKKFVLDIVEEYWILGTPEEFNIFKQEFNKEKN